MSLFRRRQARRQFSPAYLSNSYVQLLAPSGDATGVADDLKFAAAVVAGARITLQAGATYYTAAGWTINASNVDLDGSGATLRAAAANTVNPIKTDSGGNRSKVSIRNLTVSVAGDNTRAQVLIQDATDAHVENVKVTAGRWGIELLNVTRGTVRRCEVTGQTGAAIPVGIYIAGTSSYCRAIDNYVHDVTGLGIFFDSTSSTQTLLGHQCTGNRVISVTDNGIRFQTSVTTQNQGFYICSNNYVEAPGINCIRVNGYGASITGNTCKDGTAGIRDTGLGSTRLSQSNITGNTIINTTGSYSSGGIELHGADAGSTATLDGTTNVLTSVTNPSNWFVGSPITAANGGIPAGTTVTVVDTVGNTLTLSAATTIAGAAQALSTSAGGHNTIAGNYIEGHQVGINCLQTHCTITGNTCCANNGPGIWINGLGDCVITGNVCRNNDLSGVGYGGIQIAAGATNCTICGNHCFDDQTSKTQTYGINFATGSDGHCTVGNNVVGNKTGPIHWGSSTSSDIAFGNYGMEPAVITPSVGASPFAYRNLNHSPGTIVISGGTVSKIEIGHSVSGATTYYDTGLTAGAFHMLTKDYVQVTYTVAPTMKFIPHR